MKTHLPRFLVMLLAALTIVAATAQIIHTHPNKKPVPAQTAPKKKTAAKTKTTPAKKTTPKQTSKRQSAPARTTPQPTSPARVLATNQYTVNGVTFTMVSVQGGTFTMGATGEQGSDAWDDEEKPAHRVTLSDFSIGQTEVTQALWRAVMGSNPSYFKGDNLPVEQVSWEDCQEFIRRLNTLTGRRFRLPTEAEWEYAARGGAHSQGYKYAGGNYLRDVAWYGQWNGNTYDNGNSGERTHPVGTKSPNELGLYDMSGNVWEWCQDWYSSNYYSSSPSTNPTGPSTGSYRVNRGGSWSYFARNCRVSCRNYNAPSNRIINLGLRLAL